MGMIILGVFIIYCIVVLIASLIAYKFTKKLKYSILVILFFALLPTWDLLIQKAVKEYYITFKIKPKIYAYPKFDTDGKIESLGFGRGIVLPYNSMYWFKNEKQIRRFQQSSFYEKIDRKISKFYEFYASTGTFNIDKPFRVHVDGNKTKPYFVKRFKATYQIVLNKENNYLFNLFKKLQYKIINTKTNKILGECIDIDFPKTTGLANFIRRNILLLRTGASFEVDLININDMENINKTIEELFDLKLNIYITKI